MRTQAVFLPLTAFAALLGACAGLQTPAPPTPAGQSMDRPTLLYVFADP